MGEALNLSEELAETEARADFLRQQIQRATCAEAGHDMRSIGGVNAGCDEFCGCSVAVHECSRCGACDYGDTPERGETIKRCLETREPDEDSPNDR